ncbi:efflux RND transporter permease subunit [Amphiplicatus metriothermophilus]|uniref:Multidrug efflux pump subunit AcrB n=1 Tax=Amphiplicatus metriothermophilus TaxID=1519374 RepID=A0A239PXH2_9PROT|nr:efflux RND transporter permease subunit [Amphiplicatus metriothermophilus]MBB5519885.1 multidrug efflux pump subunit AcrB [Amphiplicatus metriothermophilus]SNT74788.1 Multidrug efflux pump subunit AcrB [Amphiplicatus metriothermophilus]
MNGLIAWWARNAIAANLLMVACIAAGALAFLRIEREVFPSASFNWATISVAWPGASPREVEEQIILRIEEAISDVDGIEHVEATAREGVATVTIEGKDDVDTTLFLNEIKNRVDGISTFPADAYPPVVQQLRNQEGAIFMALYGDLSERELNRLARQLRDEVAALPNGSPLVNLWGEMREEVSIEVSEEALRRYGLTFDDVARAIRGSSLNLAGGQVRTDTGNIQVAARNLADTQEDFEQIVVRQLQDGSIIRVRDVANVIDGFEDRKQRREMNGQPSISIAVQAPETLNIVKLSKAVNEWVEKKNEELAGSAQLYVWFDSADLYFARMQLVSSNAVVGLALVLIVLLLFLRPSVAFWVSIGIAVSFAGAFIFMPAAGVSLNMLSLFAFLLVIGVVVDDAIIVGESIHNQVEEGQKGVEAAILGAQLVAKPVLFAVLTTMIAFMPWLFISGGTAQFTKHITLTIVFALTFSLVEAFFILPAHLSHMKPQNRNGLFYRLQSFFAEGLMEVADRFYRPIIKTALRLRYYTVAGFVVFFSFAVALLAQGWINFKFMPEVEGTFISLTVRLPEGAPFSRSLQIFDAVEDAADGLKERYGKDKAGEDYVKAVYIRADEGQVVSYVTVTEARYRDESTEQIAEAFREILGPIPDAEEINTTYTINNGGADISFGIEAEDLETLRLATMDVQNYLRTLPGAYDVRNNLQSATPEIQIEMKPGAERFGLTLGEVARQVRQAFYGEEVQRLPRDGQDVRVMVRYPREARSSLATIEEMRIRTADGREVPLAAVADAKFAPSYKRIDRRDRKRSAMVSAELREGVDRAALMKAFHGEFMPEWRRRHPDASLAQRGDAEAQAEFMGEFFALYALALFAMYMLLAIAFSSYWQPVLIMTAIPFGFMGAAFGHFLFGLDFALFSFFGVGAAAGVVVNDNLVLIDYVNRLRAQGEGAFAALVRAGVGRFRPIILTSATTFIGLLPIMFERSTDAQFLKPTVVALAFGVFFATFVTLIFVPAMYAVGADIARFYRWAWTGEKQPPFGEGASQHSDFGEAEAARHRRPPEALRPAE